jgi:restriction system protein
MLPYIIKELKMASYQASTSDKDKGKAFRLCLLGGIIGLHYYYVGRIKDGLIRTITLNFFVIGWIIDIINIALGGFRDNVGAPLREDHKKTAAKEAAEEARKAQKPHEG